MTSMPACAASSSVIPTAGDLRMREHRVRAPPVVGRPQVVGVERGCGVTTFASWLATCLSMYGELMSPSAQTPGTDVALVLVDDDPSVGVQRDAARRDVERVACWGSGRWRRAALAS